MCGRGIQDAQKRDGFKTPGEDLELMVYDGSELSERASDANVSASYF